MSTESAPRVLLLGGLGFIGRNLLEHLVSNSLASAIRVVDKRIPPLAFLNTAQKALLKNDLVEFRQADLSQDEHVTVAFDAGEGGAPWDYVICMAAETGYGQDAERYAVTEAIAAKCGAAAAANKAKKFVYLSTATVYKSQKTPNVETATQDPWTTPAKHQQAAEAALATVTGVPTVVLRPATVYGPGDVAGLMPRAVCAAAYKQLGEKMKFLWDSSMRINTVHVRDVVRAIMHVATTPTITGVFNVVDRNATDQGKINSVLGDIFGIETGFHGKLISNVARLKMDAVVEDANDKHLEPWMALRKTHGVEHTPLSPFLSIELLRHNQLSVDGSALAGTGFTLAHPEMTKELVSEAIGAAVSAGHFPPIVPGLGTAGGTTAGAGAGSA